MAALSEMADRLAEKNVAVIGICTDADDEMDTCREILEQHNVNYLNRRDNVIITPIDASYLVGTIPGIKDDDNSVIMEITLRSGIK